MRTNVRQPADGAGGGAAGALRSEALVEEAASPRACWTGTAGCSWPTVPWRRCSGWVAGGLTGRTLPPLAYPPDEELAAEAGSRSWPRAGPLPGRRPLGAGPLPRVGLGAWDLSLVRDRRGRPELAIAMVRDLTEMKRSDHERRFFFEFMFKLIGEADSSHQPARERRPPRRPGRSGRGRGRARRPRRRRGAVGPRQRPRHPARAPRARVRRLRAPGGPVVQRRADLGSPSAARSSRSWGPSASRATAGPTSGPAAGGRRPRWPSHELTAGAPR